MQLENQVCSLELAQKLKTLGVKQESLFMWCLRVPRGSTPDEQRIDDINYILTDECGIKENKMYLPEVAAFTVAELGEMLPKGSYSVLSYQQDFEAVWSWQVKTPLANFHNGFQTQMSEADARATMLILTGGSTEEFWRDLLQ